jgi:hypothetical protein
MGSEARLIIPNERLAAGVLRNDSIRSATVALEVTVWLAPDADETQALEVLEGLEDASSARISDVTETGVSVLVAGPPVATADRLEREAALRAEALLPCARPASRAREPGSHATGVRHAVANPSLV